MQCSRSLTSSPREHLRTPMGRAWGGGSAPWLQPGTSPLCSPSWLGNKTQKGVFLGGETGGDGSVSPALSSLWGALPGVQQVSMETCSRSLLSHVRFHPVPAVPAQISQVLHSPKPPFASAAHCCDRAKAFLQHPCLQFSHQTHSLLD